MNSAVAELLKDAWAMEPRALEAFVAGIIRSEILGARRPTEMPPRTSRMTFVGDTAQILISGVLLKSVPDWLRFWGFDATGYDEIVEDMRTAMSNEAVRSIELRIASPGGQVAGVKDAADAIYSARGKKRVEAKVEDLAASAAYWLASQADAIAAGINAQVGSIGVYAAYYDASKAMQDEGIKVHVIASGPLKGMGVWGAPITEEQIKAQREVIDGLADNFVADVTRGRGRSAKDWASGRTWLAADAKRMGMIDRIGPMDELEHDDTMNSSAGGPPAAATTQKGDTMDQKEIAAAEQARKEAAEKAAKDATALEQARVKGINELFGKKDAAFALDQISKGSTVEQAKLAWADVVEAKNVQLEKDLAEAKKPGAKKPAGADVLPQDEAEGEQGRAPSGFIARAMALATERKISRRAALSALATEQPELYQAYLAECQSKARRVSGKFERISQ